MTKFRIRKGNPAGKTETSVTMVDGRKLKVNDTDWTEIDSGIFNASSMNPNFFEVEGEKPPLPLKRVSKKKPAPKAKPKKKGRKWL